MLTYGQFLQAKIPAAELRGFDPPSLPFADNKPHQSDIAAWMVRGGQRACFAAFGLGKTRIHLQVAKWVVEHVANDCPFCKQAAVEQIAIEHKCTAKKYLFVTPLGVRREFMTEQGPTVGMADIAYCRNDIEVNECQSRFIITNYERVRDGDIVIDDRFCGAGLDESSVLRSYGSKTYQTFLGLFKKVRYRFVFTATPSPNKHKELIHYGGFLGVMDTGECLTRFFKRNSTQANDLTLYPQSEEEFWLWLSTWAVFMQMPSDLGYSDEGYDLPPLNVHWHCVDVDHKKAWEIYDSWGQSQLFLDKTSGLRENAKVKRETMITRIQKALDLIKSADKIFRNGQKEIHGALVSKKQGKGKSQQSKVVSGEQSEKFSEIKSLAETKSGASCRTSEAAPDKESRQTSPKESGLVSEQQGKSQTMVEAIQAEKIRPDGGGLPRDVQETERQVCHLQSSAVSEKDDGDFPNRPLPQDGKSAGASLSQVQCGSGNVSRLSSDASEGGGLSDQYIVWCELNDEQRLIERALRAEQITFSSADGSWKIEDREDILQKWKDGERSVLISKPVLLGSGTNLQKNCCTAIFIGSTYKFNDLIQAVHRIHRFMQVRVCSIHVIYTESEDPVIAALKRKWAQHDKLVQKMSGLLRRWKLSLKPDMQLKRTLQSDRAEVIGRGENPAYRLVNNDCVNETSTWPEKCVDEIVTSIPFGNQYEYTAKVNDFGHNPNNGKFFEQMDFLVPQLLKVLKPGRIACIHVKDRIRFGSVTGTGAPTVDRFSDKVADCFEKHGFFFMGRITIDTDVVRENNQTYRLGWTEACKDMTKMGVGMPEYVLILRKPQTDLSAGFADVPVTHEKEKYGRAPWQIDAASFWRSSGDRLPDPEILLNLPMEQIGRLWKQHCLKRGYDYAEHVQISAELEKLGKLPASFMLFPPVSRNHDIWTDIVRMRTLNSEQSRRMQENHVCPLQLDIVERLIHRFSNPGEIVMDPFSGIGTVPYQAIHLGRIGWGIELSADYFKCSVGYCEQAESQRNAPTLFDLAQYTEEIHPPVDFTEAVEPPPMPVEEEKVEPRKSEPSKTKIQKGKNRARSVKKAA